MGKRSPGEGSVFQRKDGRWQASLQVNGRRRVVYGKTRAEASRKLAELRQQASGGVLPDPGRRTLSDLMDAWLETSAPNWKPKTGSDYRWLCERHLADLGRVKLSRLEPHRLQSLYADLQSQGKHRTAQRIHGMLHKALSLAVLWGWLPENPADRVLRPQCRVEQREVWSPEELAAFLAGTAGHWLQSLWVLLLASGCRLGEALALEWTDVQGSVVNITKAGQYVRGEWVVTEPKTKAGSRTVSLPPEGTAALKRQRVVQAEWRLRAGPAWTDSGLVFTGETGRPLHASVVSHALRRECRRLGLPEVTPHGLRHQHASLLLSEGLPLPEVSRRLGHAHSGITAQVYSHALAGDDSAATRAISRALSGSR
ncbi:MAG: tyrosine-type recombinase/integrase [Anaerolineae bacterium]|nr:tyrosine-type recombinase/integrase [Anaerolineae bacterium]